MAPTTPDTLSCFPYTDKDPFILKNYPQIYFAANQKSMQHEIMEGMCESKQISHFNECLSFLHFATQSYHNLI